MGFSLNETEKINKVPFLQNPGRDMQILFLSCSLNLSRKNVSFPRLNKSFPQLNKSSPQDIVSFPRLNKSFRRDNYVEGLRY